MSTLLGLYYWKQHKHRSLLPDGPPGWPVFGNALDIDTTQPHSSLMEWSRQYGDVYTINLMGQYVVVLSSAEAIHECFVTKSNEFAGRPQTFRYHYFLHHQPDVVLSNPDEQWYTAKKAMMQGLKMYGDGLQVLEDLTHDILKDFIFAIEDKKGVAFDILEDLHDAVTSIIATLIYGKQLSNDELRQLVTTDYQVSKVFASNGPGYELDMFPWLRFVSRKNFEDFKNATLAADKWFNGRVESHKEKYEESRMNGVLDYLIKVQKNAKHEGKADISDMSLENYTKNLLFAGMSTTSRALCALLLVWLNQPDVLEKVQTEIDNVIGQRLPRLSDRLSCPFTESMILELLRYISHAPLAIPHETTKDTEVQGYFIPKGTQIFPNLWTLHHSERYWKNPWQFIPERFLDKTGQLFPADHPLRKKLLPFGAGRRVCPGEALAKNRLFLFVACLAQKFNFLPEDESNIPTADPRSYSIGLPLCPARFKIRVLPRIE